MSFTGSVDVDGLAQVLVSDELELLADMSLDLAERYERSAGYMDSDEERQVALVLSRWRRDRGRHFRELSAEAARAESTHAASANTSA